MGKIFLEFLFESYLGCKYIVNVEVKGIDEDDDIYKIREEVRNYIVEKYGWSELIYGPLELTTVPLTVHEIYKFKK
jgi:hypothetical protein